MSDLKTSRKFHPIIAREGWLFIAISFICALLAQFWTRLAWAWPFWLVTLFMIQFFRDPKRAPPPKQNVALCVADGRVVAIRTCHDPYAQCEALLISVFMNLLNAHSQRAPVDGTVIKAEYFRGAFLNAALDKASSANERNALVIEMNNGERVTVVQIAGLIARRISCSVQPGDALARGQRYGFIRFGSRVDVYLPPQSRPGVAIGDKVQATSTILAELPSS
ncbi:Phosphatidylserine decarboxylase [Candidatus Glomeribacter gigasporarum BEG34]|uniref:Phosphatidylserine decarboxylase proenzyme n=1 Tax=Candidatus Glomeribacter gigasporarum BEG34 TaxID=1070319 RepID=G2JBH8_9BURK|nr:phosphatidylserine decarboxylase [Candidatus Glomeribacter gigasporarum]CCD30132.1 Phosphatidylserine decarboxylase [Candidatus Glomeribacter gigasporarum BEG34]